MPTFTKTKTFASNESPIASADLNSIGNDVATFLNVTKLDADNIQTGALTGTLLASNTIAPAKLTTTTPGHLIIGTTTTGVPTYTAITGDVTLTGGGVTAIGASKITNTMMADDAIDSAEIADGAIDLVHMSANSVDSDQYVDGSIDTAHIADSQITNAKMADDSVDSAELVDGSIDAEHLSTASLYLGSAKRETDTGAITAASDIADVPVTFTMPTTSRQVKVSFYCPSFTTSGGSTIAEVQIKEGGTILQNWKSEVLSSTADSINGCAMWILLSGVTAGSHTYKITAARSTGTGSFVMKGSATSPMQTLVELI